MLIAFKILSKQLNDLNLKLKNYKRLNNLSRKPFLAFSLIFILLFSSTIIVSSTSNSLNSKDRNQLLYQKVLDSELESFLINTQRDKIPIIIIFKEGFTSQIGYEILTIMSLKGFSIKYTYSYINGISGQIKKDSIYELASVGFIDKIYLDKEYRLEKPVNSSIEASLASIYSSNHDAIATNPLYNLGYEGSGIKIAILDSGIDSSHPDFNNRIIAERSFVDGEDTSDLNGHGTHVAGIVAGSGEASNGLYKGIAPEASLINAKCASAAGIAYTSDIIAAIEWSVDTENADVLSISLGGGAGDPNDPLSLAVDAAADKGVVVSIA
ncbi:MAG: S8 family peptidase, partial [Candidatus Odinarchaeia archaeon]